MLWRFQRAIANVGALVDGLIVADSGGRAAAGCSSSARPCSTSGGLGERVFNTAVALRDLLRSRWGTQRGDAGRALGAVVDAASIGMVALLAADPGTPTCCRRHRVQRRTSRRCLVVDQLRRDSRAGRPRERVGELSPRLRRSERYACPMMDARPSLAAHRRSAALARLGRARARLGWTL